MLDVDIEKAYNELESHKKKLQSTLPQNTNDESSESVVVKDQLRRIEDVFQFYDNTMIKSTPTLENGIRFMDAVNNLISGYYLATQS